MRPGTILVVDDEKLIRWSLSKELAKTGYLVLQAATMQEALAALSDQVPDLIILDQRLPDGSGLEILRQLRDAERDAMVVMLTAVDKSDTAVQAMKLGAYDYLTKPVDLEELKVVVEKAMESIRTRWELAHLRKEQEKRFGFSQIIGSSPAMRKVLNFVEKVAQADITTVLIIGETGTGKELVARQIHLLSRRHDKPLVTVNCSALPESLVESELFGHEKGAFTDAKSQKRGLFELADGGTVFLDEIGDISQSLQVKLLRVLEEKTFRRLGGTADLSANVRIIAATNRPLEQRLEDGQFRNDLYYRLNVASIQIPPLRERGDDVVLLADHFLQAFTKQFRRRFKGLAPDTERLFRDYSWPGNVRELKNVLERTVLLHDGDYVLPHHVHFPSLQRTKQEKPTPTTVKTESPPPLPILEKEAIINALNKCFQNQSRAAQLLGISRDTLRYRMKKYGLPSRRTSSQTIFAKEGIPNSDLGDITHPA